MKKILILILLTVPISLIAQRQLEIQGYPESTDTVATIKVNYVGSANVVGLGVYSAPQPNQGIGGYFYGGSQGIKGASTHGFGVYGESEAGTGMFGKSNDPYSVGVFGIGEGKGVKGVSLSIPVGDISSSRIGVYGLSDTVGVLGISLLENGKGVQGRTNVLRGRSVQGIALGANSIGVMGIANASNSTGVWGEGVTGAYFKGNGGTAIQLGGVWSHYSTTSDPDDAVIRSQSNQNHGDLFLVSNDEIALHLDDDGNSTSHFKVFNGDTTQILSLDESGNLTLLGSCNCSSDISRKENLTPVNTTEIVQKVSALPISVWQYRGEAMTHMGPTAQDFYAIFGLGQNNTSISLIDANGVALAAIQALKRENDELKNQLLEINQRLEKLEQ